MPSLPPRANRTWCGDEPAWAVGLALAAVAAAQLACYVTWPLVEMRARSGASAWGLGLLVAALTHVAFALGFLMIGVVRDHVLLHRLDAERIGELALVSIFFVGWLSFPAAMLVTSLVIRLHRKELLHAPG